MGGTTPNLKFPYPTGTDRVMDGDNVMQSLATAVDTHAVGSSILFTMTAGWWAHAAQSTRIYRRGNVGILCVEAVCLQAITSTPTLLGTVGADPLWATLQIARGVMQTGAGYANVVYGRNVGQLESYTTMPVGASIFGIVTFPMGNPP